MQHSPSPSQLLSPNSANQLHHEHVNLVSSPDLERDLSSPAPSSTTNEQTHSESGARKTFKTEYKSKFTPFDQYVYNEVTDSFVKPQHCTSSTSGTQDGSQMSASRSAQELAFLTQDPSYQSTEPWYKEVVRRNEKANEYRYKSEIGHNSPLLQQPTPSLRVESPYWAPSEASGTTQGSPGGEFLANTGSSGSQFSDTQTITTDIGDLAHSKQQQIKFSPHDYKRDNMIAHMAKNHNFRDQHNRDAIVQKSNGTSTRAAANSTARSTSRTPAHARSRSQSTRRQPATVATARPSAAPVSQSTSKSHQTTPVRRVAAPRPAKPLTKTTPVTSTTAATKNSSSSRLTPRPTTAKTALTSTASSKTPIAARSTPPTSTTVKRSTGVGLSSTTSRVNGVSAKPSAPTSNASNKRTPTSATSNTKPLVPSSTRQNGESPMTSTSRRLSSTSASKTAASGRTTGVSTPTSGTKSATSSHRGSASSASSARNSISAQGSASGASANNAVKSIKTPKAVAAAAAVAAASLASAALASNVSSQVNESMDQNKKQDIDIAPEIDSTSTETEAFKIEDNSSGQGLVMGSSERKDSVTLESRETSRGDLQDGNLIFTTTESGNMLADELAQAEREAKLASARYSQDFTAEAATPADHQETGNLPENPHSESIFHEEKEPEIQASRFDPVNDFQINQDSKDDTKSVSIDQFASSEDVDELPITLSKDRDLLASVHQDADLVKNLKGDCYGDMISIGYEGSNESKSNNQMDSGEELFNGIARGLVSNSSSEYNPNSHITAHTSDPIFQNANENEEPYSIMPANTQIDDYLVQNSDHDTFDVVADERIQDFDQPKILDHTQLKTQTDEEPIIEAESEHDSELVVESSNRSQLGDEKNSNEVRDFGEVPRSRPELSGTDSDVDSLDHQTLKTDELNAHEPNENPANPTDENLLELGNESLIGESTDQRSGESSGPLKISSGADQISGDNIVQEKIGEPDHELRFDDEQDDDKKVPSELEEPKLTETTVKALESSVDTPKTETSEQIDDPSTDDLEVQSSRDMDGIEPRDGVNAELISDTNIQQVENGEAIDDTKQESSHVVVKRDTGSPEELVANEIMDEIGLSHGNLPNQTKEDDHNAYPEKVVSEQPLNTNERLSTNDHAGSSSSSSSSSSDSESDDDTHKPERRSSLDLDQKDTENAGGQNVAYPPAGSDVVGEDKTKDDMVAASPERSIQIASPEPSDTQYRGPALIDSVTDLLTDERDRQSEHKDTVAEDPVNDSGSEHELDGQAKNEVGQSSSAEAEESPEVKAAKLDASDSLSSCEPDIQMAGIEPKVFESDAHGENQKDEPMIGNQNDDDLMESVDRINLNDNLDDDENQKLSNHLTNSEDELILSPRNFNYNFSSNNNQLEDRANFDGNKTVDGVPEIKKMDLLAELDLMACDDCLDGDLKLRDGSSATFETANSAAESRFELMAEGGRGLEKMNSSMESDKPRVTYLIDGKSPLAEISASEVDDDDDNDETDELQVREAANEWMQKQAPESPLKAWGPTDGQGILSPDAMGTTTSASELEARKVEPNEVAALAPTPATHDSNLDLAQKDF